MGKKIKKGTRGEAVQYMTRSQALRKLQLSLKEFRRLCILKGIFPKEPKKKFKGMNKTYYLSKDIRFLAHEELLTKFRNISAYNKKIKKAQARKEKFEVQHLQKNKPKYSIDHILKERYPRFVDALYDLDDALSLIALYATLPKHELLNIDTKTIYLCKRLINEFYLYCALTQNLKKGFISIKGIYLTVEILGVEITWLQPFNYPQKLTYDVDYSIMQSFIELYTNLVKFVNVKLFKDVGVEYPPNLEQMSLPLFGYNSLELQGLQNAIQSQNSNEKTNFEEELAGNSEEVKKIIEKEKENKALKSLFSGYVFYVSREVPKDVIIFAIQSCGGLYGDDSDNTTFNEDDPRITHYIVDKPVEFINIKPNKEYIQPQWIIDCINKRTLLPVAEYSPGKTLPPHYSPYYEYDGSQYKLKKNINVNIDEDEEYSKLNNTKSKTDASKDDGDKELREMMLSRNKKKLLAKIREEKKKKRKTNMK